MAKGRIQVTIDEDLYQGIKKLPREVSVSEVINLLLKMAIEEVKLGREMSDKEVNEWFRKDPQRLKVRMYMQEKLGPYIEVLDEAIEKVKPKKKKDK